VRAGAEGQMPVGLAADIEPIGVGELGRVAVGGADAERDEGTGRYGDPADLGRCRADVIAVLIGAFEAQDFLHRGADQAGAAPV
jgi:hypothetical protein